jgi:hypothetical protein
MFSGALRRTVLALVGRGIVLDPPTRVKAAQRRSMA